MGSKNDILPKEDAITGARLAIDNAQELIGSAELLAVDSRYGPAHSLSVLGVEEAVKGLVLAMYGAGTFEGMPHAGAIHSLLGKVLYRHGPRHDVGKIYTLFALQMKEAIEEQGADGEEGESIDWSPKYIIPRAITAVQNVAVMLYEDDNVEGFDNQIAALDDSSRAVIDVWESADQAKKGGFYVDYDDGEWLAPQRKNGDQFERLIGVFEPMIDFCTTVVKVAEDEGKH